MVFTFKKYNNILVKYITEFLNEHQGWNYYHVQMVKHQECFPQFLILRYNLITMFCYTFGFEHQVYPPKSVILKMLDVRLRWHHLMGFLMQI